jgi:hypothetical protein
LVCFTPTSSCSEVVGSFVQMIQFQCLPSEVKSLSKLSIHCSPVTFGLYGGNTSTLRDIIAYLLLYQQLPVHILEPWVAHQFLEVALSTQSLRLVTHQALRIIILIFNSLNEVFGFFRRLRPIWESQFTVFYELEHDRLILVIKWRQTVHHLVP